MKKVLMVSAAVIACAASAPAFAAPYGGSVPSFMGDDAGTNPGASTIVSSIPFEVEGTNPAKCGVSVNNGAYLELELADNVITHSNGFVREDLADTIAAGLTAKNATAWCTGNTNRINISRSALYADSGTPTANGFRKAVIYDLNVKIADAQRTAAFGGGAAYEGTSDGEGLGPDITSFGPTIAGSALTFEKEPGSTVVPVDEPYAGTLKRSDFSESPAYRLAAGFYEGWVKVTITPGF